MTSGGQGAAVIQEIRPGTGLTTGDFVKEKLGGYRRMNRVHSFEDSSRAEVLVGLRERMMNVFEAMFRVRY